MIFSFIFVHLKIITTLQYVSDQNVEVSHFLLNMLGNIHLGSDDVPLDIKATVLGKTEFTRLPVWFGFPSTKHHQ